MKEFRTGIGYDVHCFEEGRKLFLGGVEIPYHKGLKGHSDADVLIHSLCDSLLGAAGFEDIGHQFPDTDPKYKGIPSIVLLKSTVQLLFESGWKIVNTDSALILEEPKIYPYISAMKSVLRETLKTENVSIKATTSEGLGFAGRKEGCSCYSVALIERESNAC